MQSFDRDPQWDGHNNRAARPEPQPVRQDFGFSATTHVGGSKPGEIGGHTTPAAEPAYYAKRISTATFKDRLRASGKLACTDPHFHVLVGFFNSHTINEWRAPNSIVFRLYGRGDVFYAYVEYATSRWRAGGDSPGGFPVIEDPEHPGRTQFRGFASKGAVHTWSLAYDPEGNDGKGSVIATIDDQKSVCHLDLGHKADGATFNRFGLLSIPKHFDQGGAIWFDDIDVNGDREDFDSDPKWDAVGNRRMYTTFSVRPRFDFGFSDTQFAGGKGRGELGGVIFRGDNRDPDKLAYYGDRLEKLTVEKPLRAGGKVVLRRGISDSTTLFGFFNSQKSVEVSRSQSSGFPMNFLGVAIEGPSREGFLVYPVYRFPEGADGYARGSELPHIMPDGKMHDWSLDYDPAGRGRMTVSFDGQKVHLDLADGHRKAPAEFDRFGIVSTWIDGNAQHVYFDDLSYTWRQN
jgi:hypothetical protein